MSKLSIGIDVGGTKILAAAIDPSDSTILFESRAETPDSAEALVSALADIVPFVCEGANAVAGNTEPVVMGVGLGLPGLVDSTGMLRAAPNLQCVIDVDVKSRLEAVFGYSVIVENDASCAAWAEATLGAGRGVGDMMLVTLGTGIGGGIVRDGELVRGAHGFAGEPGHMLVDPSGPTCTCGRSGCWERFASGSGLGWLGSRAALRGDAPDLLERVGGDAERIDGELVSLAAQSGDQGALDVFSEFSWWLAAGLANLANILDPELLLVGGGLADCADLFLEQTRVHFRELVLGGKARTGTGIEVATLGSRAGAVGAALLAVGAATQES